MTVIRIEAIKNILSAKRFSIGVLIKTTYMKPQEHNKKTTKAKKKLSCFLSNTSIRCWISCLSNSVFSSSTDILQRFPIWVQLLFFIDWTGLGFVHHIHCGSVVCFHCKALSQHELIFRMFTDLHWREDVYRKFYNISNRKFP